MAFVPIVLHKITGLGAADRWTGVYLPGPAESVGKLHLEDAAVVVPREHGEYWVLYQGYLAPARVEGSSLVVPPLPRPQGCPLGRRECEPPITRIESTQGGVRIGQDVLAAHSSGAFLRGLPESFTFASVGGQDRLRYQHGTLTYELQVDDAERRRCLVGVLVPSFRSPPANADGYLARELALAFVHDPGRDPSSATCAPIDPTRVHLIKMEPGLALVTNQAGQVAGAYELSYMYEALFAPTPPPPKAELVKIARLGARALGAHVGQSAE